MSFWTKIPHHLSLFIFHVTRRVSLFYRFFKCYHAAFQGHLASSFDSLSRGTKNHALSKHIGHT